MSIGLSSIIYMLSAVCLAKMASSDVCMKLGVRTCITVTFLTTALYCVLVPQCSSVYMIFVLQILPGMATGILFSYLQVKLRNKYHKNQSQQLCASSKRYML